MMILSDKEIRLRQRLKDDFQFYAEKSLKIRRKSKLTEIDASHTDKISPFVLNKAQLYIHKLLEEQRAKTGRVRALLLKGRQQGCSTYVGGRYYWRTTHQSGYKTFILAHLEDATDNLFKMVKRFHEHSNPLLRPSTSNSNRKELIFDKLDSAYGLGTAGSGNVGRSDTIDLFHGSEVAFWKNPAEIRAGVMQAASEADEIILETTANGFDPLFHPMWTTAEKGMSEYIAIFVPWFWQDEYERDVTDELTAEENELLRLYGKQGLTARNLFWRRNKLTSDFSGDNTLFKQEYPCCSSEAFQVTGVDPFIRPEIFLKARKTENIQPSGVHLVGLDPARGGDRTAFMHRQGRVVWDGKIYKTPDTKAIKGEVRRLFEEPDNPLNPIDYLIMDIGGLGGPIYDDLKDMPFGRYVIPVNFGAKDVFKPQRYVNRKAEMWGESRDWLSNEDLPVSVPDRDELQTDACSTSFKYDHLQRIQMESKDSLKTRGVSSPDEWEAVALTFAQPFSARHKRDQVHTIRKKRSRLA